MLREGTHLASIHIADPIGLRQHGLPSLLTTGDQISRGSRHVDGLAAVVRAREGRAGQVGVEDAEMLVRVAFDEPGEAGAEHGICGGDEGLAEGLQGGEVG